MSKENSCEGLGHRGFPQTRIGPSHYHKFTTTEEYIPTYICMYVDVLLTTVYELWRSLSYRLGCGNLSPRESGSATRGVDIHS